MRIHQSRAVPGPLSLVMAGACHRHRAPARRRPSRRRQGLRPRELHSSAPDEDVVDAMHDRYVGKWYTTLTFRQKTSRLLPNGKWNVQTWYEAMKLPGRLRIDFDPCQRGERRALRARQPVRRAERPPAARRSGDQPAPRCSASTSTRRPVAHTTARLRREGFDLSQVHETTFQGKPMIVVGARKGDYNRKQFWIDAERLLFVRMLEPTPRDTTKMQDIRFVNYERRGAAWVSPRVEIWSDGKLVFYEDYEDIRVNVTLDDGLFDPAKWKKGSDTHRRDSAVHPASAARRRPGVGSVPARRAVCARVRLERAVRGLAPSSRTTSTSSTPAFERCWIAERDGENIGCVFVTEGSRRGRRRQAAPAPRPARRRAGSASDAGWSTSAPASPATRATTRSPSGPTASLTTARTDLRRRRLHEDPRGGPRHLRQAAHRGDVGDDA